MNWKCIRLGVVSTLQGLKNTDDYNNLSLFLYMQPVIIMQEISSIRRAALMLSACFQKYFMSLRGLQNCCYATRRTSASETVFCRRGSARCPAHIGTRSRAPGAWSRPAQAERRQPAGVFTFPHPSDLTISPFESGFRKNNQQLIQKALRRVYWFFRMPQQCSLRWKHHPRPWYLDSIPYILLLYFPAGVAFQQLKGRR